MRSRSFVLATRRAPGAGRLVASAPSAQSSGTVQGVSPAITALLTDIRKADRGQLAVSEEDGRFLRLLVTSSGSKRALEIGAASGYSAIWIGLGLRETGGRLVTIEYDPQRAKEAQANIAKAGLSDIVSGRARRRLRRHSGHPGTVRLRLSGRVETRLSAFLRHGLSRGCRVAGLFVAHNVLNKKSEMGDFLTTIETHPNLFTTIVAPSGEGVSVSVKRK